MTAIDVEVQVGTTPDVDVDVQVAPPTFTVVSVLPTGPRGPRGFQGEQGEQGEPGEAGEGGGAVDSVNGETGVVVLDAADVGAEPAGAVATHAADTTNVHGIADTAALVLTGDARLSNARTPTAHAASHQDGGSDELALDGSQIVSGTVADARIPSGITRDSELNSAVADEVTARNAAIAVAIAALVDSAPGLLDTLNEIAAALGDDPNFAATITALLATKVAKADFNANTIVKADADDTPAPLTVGEQTIVGRKTGGNIAALTAAEVRTLLALVVGTNVQEWDGDLDTLAANITVFGQSLAAAEDAAAGRSVLDLGSAATADVGDFDAAGEASAAQAVALDALADHVDETTAAHAASAIEFTPDGSIAATNVQAAIQEVRDEAGNGSITTILADDEDITVPAAAGTTVVLYTALTEEHYVTLPPASGPPQVVIVKDVNGLANGSSAGISIVAHGADTIVGAMGISTNWVGVAAVQVLVQYTNDGVDTWAEIGETSPLVAGVLTYLAAGVGAAVIGSTAGGSDIDDADTVLLSTPLAAWNAANVNALTGPITLTLPPTTELLTGLTNYAIVDCTGDCSPSNTITVECDPTDEFLIPGVGYDPGPIVLDAPCASLLLYAPNTVGGPFAKGQWQVLSQLPNPAGSAETYSESNVATDRELDANATSIDELADVLGTLIGDLRARGIVA